MSYNGPLPQVVKAGGTGAATLTGVVIGSGTSALTGNALTQYDVLVGGASNAISSVGPGTSLQVLQSGGNAANPAYSTATYPSTTTINQILYSSAANTVTGLATANQGVLTTGATGIPVITPIAVNGQLIIGSTAGAPAAATLTAGTGISITNASNSITIAVASGASVVQTLTGNSGGAISPTAGNINTVGTGSITIAGAGNTLTTQLTGLTNHNVLIGAGSATITKVAPSATSGVPLISQGAASDPAFGTAVVAGGGTGNTTFTAYAPVCAGTTATGVFQSASTNFGTSGYVLTSTGSASLPTWQAAAGGITTIDGDSGSATGATVTIEANVASNGCGNTVSFSGSGSTLLMNFSDSNYNVCLGYNCGPSGAIATLFNVGVGYQVYNSLSTSAANVAMGRLALNAIATGGGVNVGLGCQALQSVATGEVNVGIGYLAGASYTTSESHNIVILSAGVTGESNVIRIGTQGAGVGQQNICYIAGITGVAVSNSAAVLLDTTTGQLGTMVSSKRYKEDIQDMRDRSSQVLNLRPITFNFKSDKNKELQFGLIAEEVDEIMPELVTYNAEGLPETVRYHEIPVLLLNEIIKLRKEVESLKRAK